MIGPLDKTISLNVYSCPLFEAPTKIVLGMYAFLSCAVMPGCYVR